MEEKFKMKTCCLLANVALADLLSEVIDVNQSGVLPDGDHVNTPTALWLENIVNKMYDTVSRTESGGE